MKDNTADAFAGSALIERGEKQLFTDFGLVSYVYTQTVSRAVRLSGGLHSGMVGLNRGLVSDVGAPSAE
ncbi:hypothetical protein [Catellatospora sp. NPDC049133]|uniref:hypothetical protein n=1 Tax=Catellatospora sp. NPDC049133 TaxID=3155499 RepID=UPI00340BEE10